MDNCPFYYQEGNQRRRVLYHANNTWIIGEKKKDSNLLQCNDILLDVTPEFQYYEETEKLPTLTEKTQWLSVKTDEDNKTAVDLVETTASISPVYGEETHNPDSKDTSVADEIKNTEGLFDSHFMIYLCIGLLTIIVLMGAFFICLWIRAKKKKSSTEKVEENEVYGRFDAEDYLTGKVETYVKDDNDYYGSHPPPSEHGDTEQSVMNS